MVQQHLDKNLLTKYLPLHLTPIHLKAEKGPLQHSHLFKLDYVIFTIVLGKQKIIIIKSNLLEVIILKYSLQFKHIILIVSQ